MTNNPCQESIDNLYKLMEELKKEARSLAKDLEAISERYKKLQAQRLEENKKILETLKITMRGGK